MANAISNHGAKWVDQIPKHIQDKLEQTGKDYTLADVISICEEIIDSYDQNDLLKTWNVLNVADIMNSTVNYRNKFKRYVK
jgi:hypothetical protein